MHPLLVAWVRDGINREQALAAVAVARTNLGDREIPAKYLDTILRDMPQPKANGNGVNSPAAPRRLTAGEIIEQAIRDGHSDERIEAMPELELVPDLRNWIREKREEIHRAEH